MEDPKTMNGVTLAFIGDAVMSLKVREYLVAKGCQKTDVLQKRSVRWVSAKAQASFLRKLQDQAFFTEAETDIILRGRNANTGTKAKNADIITYRLSTGFEALWGYLYLGGQSERLEELWEAVKQLGEQV